MITFLEGDKTPACFVYPAIIECIKSNYFNSKRRTSKTKSELDFVRMNSFSYLKRLLCMSRIFTSIKLSAFEKIPHFESITFKFSMLFFIISLAFASYVLYKLKEYTYHRAQMVRIHLWASGITTVISCIASLILFTISIYPAFHESSIAFTILASMLFMNIGCLLLQD